MTKGTTTTSYTYDDAERMSKAGSTTYAYDNNGNMTSSTTGTTTTNYTYDFEDQMVRAGTKTYARDPFGRAVSATSGTTKTDYIFDGAEAIQQTTGTATPVYYTRGLGDRVLSRRAGTATPSYYHYDSIGSVMGISSGTKLTDTYSYDAFGNVRSRSGTSTQPYQYVGNAYDSTTKLYDFHAKMYDSSVGRFTSKDPVSGFATMPQTLNLYTYSWNNPFLYPDPSALRTDGTCYGVNWGFGKGVVGELCEVEDDNSNIAITLSGGGGGATPAFGHGPSYQHSNADTVMDLGGLGSYHGVGIGEGFGGDVTIGLSKDDEGNAIVTENVGVDIGTVKRLV